MTDHWAVEGGGGGGTGAEPVDPAAPGGTALRGKPADVPCGTALAAAGQTGGAGSCEGAWGGKSWIEPDNHAASAGCSGWGSGWLEGWIDRRATSELVVYFVTNSQNEGSWNSGRGWSGEV